MINDPTNHKSQTTIVFSHSRLYIFLIRKITTPNETMVVINTQGKTRPRTKDNTEDTVFTINAVLKFPFTLSIFVTNISIPVPNNRPNKTVINSNTTIDITSLSKYFSRIVFKI